jgi:hemerythrin-like metal-binding protein
MFTWSEEYSVGIQSIDNQHKELFKLLNKLLEAMKQGQASNVTTEIIMDLEKYAIIHFQKEEFFFHRFNFSGADEHILEHQHFIQKVASLKTELKSGKIVITFDLLNFLKEWIDHHIQKVDKEYSRCFIENGLR